MESPKTVTFAERHRYRNGSLLRRWGGLSVAFQLIAYLTAALCGAGRAEAGTDERPLNFVLFVVDDLGWSDLGCYGSDLHETPRIDRLARTGMRFTDAYAAAPVCSPTRASIMTGKYPARLHITTWYGDAVDPEVNKEPNLKLIPPASEHNLAHREVTIAEALKRAGYLTAHIGKWHLGDPAHYPQTQGFDINIGGTFSGCPASFFSPFFDADGNAMPGLRTTRKGEYLTDRLTDEAVNFIGGTDGRPFFLHLAYYAVHTPIEGKPELVERYRKKIKPGMVHRNPAYAAMVESVDRSVGRVLDKLDELGIADRTVVILISDNGGAHYRYRGQIITSNRPLRAGKGTLYEGGVRVPLIVRWPGKTPARTVCREPVISNDLYPTILDIAGVRDDRSHSDGIDGLSLVPLLEDPSARLPRDALFWHYPHYYYGMNTPVSSIRQGRWKLLEHLEDGRLELYDLARDIGETNNLAAAMPEKAERLRQRLDAWRRKVGARMPKPNPNWRPKREAHP
ncbi:MAG: sulfatase [Planctomycetes bacterium]|nr:sulfatase [Planctomycetota bacterium]